VLSFISNKRKIKQEVEFKPESDVGKQDKAPKKENTFSNY